MNYFAENADNLTGREQLERIMQGQGAPHFSKLLGMRLIEIGDGTATFEAFPSERFYNPGGSVHGGFYATIIDSAMGCAVQTRMAKGTRFGTIELKTNFIRRMTAATGRIICRGWVVHFGRRMQTAEARLEDEKGKLYGHGSGTFLVYAETADVR
jgi:uncharacterized protein (TIGR00369 family)